MNATLSPKYAEARRRLNQRLADLAADAVLTDAPASAPRFAPVRCNREHWSGELWIYEAQDAALIEAGLLDASDLPGRAPGCRIKRTAGKDFLAAYRMADGRVRLTISAHLVRRCDRGFVEFMAQSVGAAIVDRIAGGDPRGR
jgi:hypothetical protein